MNYFLVVFSNRTETLDFANKLKCYNINASVISTPQALGGGCSISVKIYEFFFETAMRVFRQQHYLTFSAFYKASYDGKGNYKFEKILLYF